MNKKNNEGQTKQPDNNASEEFVRVKRSWFEWTQWSCFVLGGIQIIKPWGMTVRQMIETALSWFGALS